MSLHIYFIHYLPFISGQAVKMKIKISKEEKKVGILVRTSKNNIYDKTCMNCTFLPF